MVEAITQNTSEFLFGIILGLVFGAGIGFFLGRYSLKIKGKTLKDFEVNIIIFIVSLIWVMSTLLEMFSQTYETPLFINVVFGAVVGFLLDVDFLKYFKK